LDRAIIQGALASYTQAGRVMFDMNKKRYRVRELSREPLPYEQLRFSNPREKSATDFIAQGKVQTVVEPRADKQLKMRGEVKDKNQTYQTELLLGKSNLSMSFFPKK
jgi:hypothetical protein